MRFNVGPYLNRNQQQDSMFRDPVPPLRNDANHMVLDLPGSGSALERNSGSGSEPYIPALSKQIPPPKLDSEIHSQMLRVEDQADHVLTLERDSNHIEQPSPGSIRVLQKVVGKQNRCDLKHLLNPVSLEGTPSFNDTEGQHSTKVSHITTHTSASLAHSTVRTKSSDKMNQDPVRTAPRPTQTLESSSLEMMQRDSTVQTATMPPPTEHWTTKTLDSEENPAELPATPRPSPDEDPIGTHSPKLVNDPLCLHPDAVVRTTQDALNRPSILGSEPLALTALEISANQDLPTSREGSCSEVCSQKDDSRMKRTRSNPFVFHPECLALTDEQCKKIQKIVDPNDTRINKLWETELQPKLIRLYMTGKSFPQIESEMDSRLSWT